MLLDRATLPAPGVHTVVGRMAPLHSPPGRGRWVPAPCTPLLHFALCGVNLVWQHSSATQLCSKLVLGVNVPLPAPSVDPAVAAALHYLLIPLCPRPPPQVGSLLADTGYAARLRSRGIRIDKISDGPITKF